MDQAAETMTETVTKPYCPHCTRPKLFCDCEDEQIVTAVLASFEKGYAD